LHHVLELLDVDEARALATHPVFDLRLDLPADLFILALDEARCSDGFGNLVAEPWHDARLARGVAGLVATDDLRELRRAVDGQVVAEGEGRGGSAHGFRFWRWVDAEKMVLEARDGDAALGLIFAAALGVARFAR